MNNENCDSNGGIVVNKSDSIDSFDKELCQELLPSNCLENRLNYSMKSNLNDLDSNGEKVDYMSDLFNIELASKPILSHEISPTKDSPKSSVIVVDLGACATKGDTVYNRGDKDTIGINLDRKPIESVRKLSAIDTKTDTKSNSESAVKLHEKLIGNHAVKCMNEKLFYEKGCHLVDEIDVNSSVSPPKKIDRGRPTGHAGLKIGIKVSKLNKLSSLNKAKWSPAKKSPAGKYLYTRGKFAEVRPSPKEHVKVKDKIKQYEMKVEAEAKKEVNSKPKSEDQRIKPEKIKLMTENINAQYIVIEMCI